MTKIVGRSNKRNTKRESEVTKYALLNIYCYQLIILLHYTITKGFSV